MKKRPKRRQKRQINLRITEDLRRRLRIEADSRGVSVNWLMTRLLRDAVDRAEKQALTDRMCELYADRI